MIDINNFPILTRHISTLKETSKDDHNGIVTYMTNAEAHAINFDDVKSEYVSLLALSESPKSNDALFINSSDLATFIEFKNGYFDKPKEFAVRKKVYDSILILNDIINENISFSRKHLDYILVYNESKNPDSKTSYSSSESRDYIDKTLLGFGNERLIKFGLERFQGYCFKNVYTYTEKEFEENFVTSIA
jgi:hypothetical protein